MMPEAEQFLLMSSNAGLAAPRNVNSMSVLRGMTRRLQRGVYLKSRNKTNVEQMPTSRKVHLRLQTKQNKTLQKIWKATFDAEPLTQYWHRKLARWMNLSYTWLFRPLE
jgi:hypothetical protein